MRLCRCALLLTAVLALATAGCVVRDPVNPFSSPAGLRPLP